MTLRRFKAAPPLKAGAVVIAGEEARHLRVVLRARAKERIVVFDGAGGEAEAEIESIGRDAVTCRIVSDVRRLAPPRARIELWCALPRAGAADDVVRVAVEAGATAIRPLVAERGVWRPDDAGEEQRAERFMRASVAALKQSGRGFLPELLPSAAPRDLSIGPGVLALLGSIAPGSRNVADVLADRRAAASALVIVGPEGGLTEEEESGLVGRGAIPVRCGGGTLRVETAVVALLAHVVALLE